MRLFCKLITAWVDYSLSAGGTDTDASVQSVSQSDSQRPERHEAARLRYRINVLLTLLNEDNHL